MPLPSDQEGAPDGDEAEAGIVQIADDDYIIRKIPSAHMQPADSGHRRISKSAFSASSASVDPEEGMSVNSEQLLQAAGVDLRQFAPEFPALARLNVGQVRALELTIEHRPIKGDRTHCQVLGVKEKHRKKLLRLAEFPRKPPDVV
ncbi:MAG TPA: hypothetical protein VD887_10350 [Allosphingosinicella sp.]|nr:hypothetical protein [Allosphingosinicella sp.]